MAIDTVLVWYCALTFLTMVVLATLCIISCRKIKFDDFITIITAAPFWPVVLFIVVMCLVDHCKTVRKMKEADKNGNSA